MTHTPALPIVEELRPAPAAEELFVRLAGRRNCIFFDSALRHAELGRYSFLAADPFAWIETPVDAADPLSLLQQQMLPFKTETRRDLPPFQGGAAGLLSYDLGRSLEKIPAPRIDEFGVPTMAMGLYDVVIAFDHLEQRAWIISQGFPETDPAHRHTRATARLAEVRAWLESSPASVTPTPTWPTATLPALDASELAPQHKVLRHAEVTSNFSKAQYLAAVGRAIEYIAAGDIFQVNLAQRLLHPAREASVPLYLRLRERNAATFAGYFDLGEFQLCSASPERFVQVRSGLVEARPIKGTRALTSQAEASLFAGDDLQQSEKDRAENVMIVDLLRNDLSRVCEPASVQVTQLFGLERYAFVQHLVSVVQGRLRSQATPVDLLRGAFPGGSITGAPKVRAMEIIAELEPTARGPYCGSLGYLGFDGTLDTSILIRTITAGRGWWQLPVGGGIVAQSTPEREYEETWHKAEGMLRALAP